MSNFVHLHVHSEYSLLDGLSRIKELIAKAKDYDMPALALTDHGSMYGAIKFYLACKEAGIKPIIGMEAYQAERSRHDKQAGVDSDQYHLLLLAKNLIGYKNLMKLTSYAHLEGFYYKPRLDWELLEKYHEGIVCTSACTGGLVGSLIEKGNVPEAEKVALKYQELFGEDNYYLEIQHHPGLDKINAIYDQIGKMSRRLGIPLVATNDSHYTNKEDAQGQETLLCIQTQKTWEDKNRPLSMIDCPDFYFKSPQEMAGAFGQYPDALENTVQIAERCQIEIPMDQYIFPNFPLPLGENYDSYLAKLVAEKRASRYEQETAEVQERITHELSIIKMKGFSSYFLVFEDFTRWSVEQGIRHNCRGSAAGSIVSYILGISTLDPLEYKLPFERFLHEFRPTPPDIDMDLSDDGRDLVIDYVRNKYGDDKVAQVITFGTMETRAAVRDVARALAYPYAIGDRLAKIIPVGSQGFPMTFEKALEVSPELADAYEKEVDTKKILDLAKKLEGITRHASVHAAGVVIADKDITEYTPLQRDPKGGKIITQYDMYSLDLNVSKHAVGLLKMDFLGLRNLAILGHAVTFVKDNQGRDVDLDKISQDDSDVYKMLSAGNTTGVFQLESGGMRKLAKDLKPNVIYDLGAMVALYRPGPMEIIPEFIKRKNHPETVTYLHLDLKPILEETYGLIIYQEQVMQIANQMGGYSMAEADGFRKAMGKKLPELMKKEGEKFKSGMVAKGYKKELAEQIFALIEKFAAYGFNKAHSASYGLVAYQTAYMKYHYPVEYMTAMFTAEARGNTGDSKNEKIQMCVEECKRMKIKVLPPDINTSAVEFTIEGTAIRFGLSAIKNVGAAAIESILKVRTSAFLDIDDFITRVDLQKVNKKVLESLIRAGALDVFGRRSALLAALDGMLTEAHKKKKKIGNGDSGQGGLFDGLEGEEDGAVSFKLPDLPELPREELLSLELEYLGFYLSEHPRQKKLEQLDDLVTHDIGDLTPDEHLSKVVTVGGIIVNIRRVFTKKNNEEMAFVTLQGVKGAKIDCVVFPKVFSQNGNKDFWQENTVLVCSGKVDNREDRLSLVIDRVQKID